MEKLFFLFFVFFNFLYKNYNFDISVGSSQVVKKARLSGSSHQVQTSGSGLPDQTSGSGLPDQTSGSGLPDQTFYMKVTLSCSGQYITQHIGNIIL